MNKKIFYNEAHAIPIDVMRRYAQTCAPLVSEGINQMLNVLSYQNIPFDEVPANFSMSNCHIQYLTLVINIIDDPTDPTNL